MFEKCFLSLKKSWLNLTSSSLILSNCSEWTARAWKGSWLATVESQGCTFENVRNIDISQFMQNCAPLPTRPNHPPRPPPCQLSPWKILVMKKVSKNQSYRSSIFVNASFSSSHAFASTMVCDWLVWGIHPIPGYVSEESRSKK